MGVVTSLSFTRPRESRPKPKLDEKARELGFTKDTHVRLKENPTWKASIEKITNRGLIFKGRGSKPWHPEMFELDVD